MENAQNVAINDEINAMSAVANALAPLNGEARERILEWACKLYGVGSIAVTKRISEAHTENDNMTLGTTPPSKSVAELFDIADPQTGAEKALVVAYWLQHIEGQDGFSSQSVNSELKNLGHGVANITVAFTDLIGQKLALQVQKSGKSQQARKLYKLTRTGLQRVEAMITKNSGE